MARPPARDATALLVAWHEGDMGAFDQLVPLVYGELRRIAHIRMRGERRTGTLQTTALVNEAYLRLIDINRVRWQNRAHFYAVAASVMRRILVDAARERGARKRGGDHSHIELDEGVLPAPERGADLVALDEALVGLARLDPRKSRVVELRCFGGLSVEETAEVIGVSTDTVLRDWKMAKLWLRRELRRGAGAGAEEA